MSRSAGCTCCTCHVPGHLPSHPPQLALSSCHSLRAFTHASLDEVPADVALTVAWRQGPPNCVVALFVVDGAMLRSVDLKWAVEQGCDSAAVCLAATGSVASRPLVAVVTVAVTVFLRGNHAGCTAGSTPVHSRQHAGTSGRPHASI